MNDNKQIKAIKDTVKQTNKAINLILEKVNTMIDLRFNSIRMRHCYNDVMTQDDLYEEEKTLSKITKIVATLRYNIEWFKAHLTPEEKAKQHKLRLMKQLKDILPELDS